MRLSQVDKVGQMGKGADLKSTFEECRQILGVCPGVLVERHEAARMSKIMDVVQDIFDGDARRKVGEEGRQGVAVNRFGIERRFVVGGEFHDAQEEKAHSRRRRPWAGWLNRQQE